MHKIVKYFHTLRYLKWQQYTYRFYKHIRPIKYNIENNILRQPWAFSWDAPTYKKQSLFENDICIFLNKQATITQQTDWNNADYSKLWLYNLHYFDELDTHQSEDRTQLALKWILKWIKENPAALGNGWEPYPLSMRIINWIKWLSKHSVALPAIDNSLALQVRVLEQKIEYHLLANHLFSNAQALIFAGAWLTGNQANRWLKKGLSLLEAEVKEQFLQDGAHFELSPMYHANLILSVLDIINLARCSQNQFLLSKKDQLKTIVQKGVFWLEAMYHPDDNLSFFNDAAFCNAPSLTLLKEYAYSLNIPAPAGLNLSKAPSFLHLQDSGFVRIQSGNAVALLDVGKIGPDYQPGHAHADTLSFELSINSQRVFVNSGTSEYSLGPERDWQRSTHAHNTVTVMDLNSSEVWGGFRVARRAKPFDLLVEQNVETIKVACSHDGYQHLKSNITHRREWCFNKNTLHIMDTVEKAAMAVAYYHLHPYMRVKQINKNSIEIIMPSDQRIIVHFSEAQVLLKDGYWYPEFGKKIPNKRLKVIFSHYLKTMIEW